MALHDLVALLSQLEPRRRMNRIVDAGVQRLEASQHLRVSRINDCIDLQPRDIRLYDRNTAFAICH